MNDKSVTLEFSRDGGQTWQLIGHSTSDLDSIFAQDSDAASSETRPLALSGSLTFEPKKPRKVRQTPPFWSAYR